MQKGEYRSNCGAPRSACGCEQHENENARCLDERIQRDRCGNGDVCLIDERPRYERCGCGAPGREHSFGLRGYPLASVYSPLQEFHELYDPETALKRGTIFKELDLPFYGGCSDSEGKCGGGRYGR